MAKSSNHLLKSLFFKRSFLVSFSIYLIFLSACNTSSVNTFIDYRRVGGLINFDDHLLIDLDGNTNITRRNKSCEIVLANEEMNKLKETFENALFSELDKEYLPQDQGGDLIEYTIVYEGRTVKTKDGTVPDALWPPLEMLNQLLERCS